MSIKLKDLIVKVRKSKTAAEERAVIAKECALIRTSFKDPNIALQDYYRPRNVLKLIFIHLTAVNNNSKYPPVAHFGQMEAIKLVAKQPFYQKRIGYLALSVLVRNDTSLLTLVTNSVSLDLQKVDAKSGFGGSERYGEKELCTILALNCLANVSNKDMLLNLAQNIFKLVRSKRNYIQKKALLCINKILEKDEDLIPDFIDRVITIFKDNSGSTSSVSVLMNCITVFIKMVQLGDEQCSRKLEREVLPGCLDLIDKLNIKKNFGDNDFQGVAEPFLQVKIIHFVGELGKVLPGTVSFVENMLMSVLQSTPKKKNIGNAVLFEVVKSISKIVSGVNGGSPEGERLEAKALELLVEFLSEKEGDQSGNKRCLSILTINNLMKENVSRYDVFFKKHQDRFISCLKDSDISIVQASLNLIFTMLNTENCQNLVPELVGYASKTSSPVDHKQFICEKLFHFLKFKLSSQTLLDFKMFTTLQLLVVCDPQIPEYGYKFVTNLCLSAESSSSSKFLLYIMLYVHKIIETLSIDSHLNVCRTFLSVFAPRASLLSTWMENHQNETLADILGHVTGMDSTLERFSFPLENTRFDADFLFNLLKKILMSPDSTPDVKAMSLSCLPQIVAHFSPEAAILDAIRKILLNFATAINIEHQSRAAEFVSLLKAGNSNPALMSTIFAPSGAPGLDSFKVEFATKEITSNQYGMLEMEAEETKDDLLELDMDNVGEDGGYNNNDKSDDLLGGLDEVSTGQVHLNLSSGPSLDPFSDLGGLSPAKKNEDDLLGNFDDMSVSENFVEAVGQNGVKILLKRTSAHPLILDLEMSTGGIADLENVELGIAAPKIFDLQLKEKTTGTKLLSNRRNKIIKSVTVANTSIPNDFSSLAFKLRLSYNKSGDDAFGLGFGDTSSDRIVEDIVLKEVAKICL